MVLFAYAGLFGFFSVYDDEGYNVAMIRLVSEGVPLYTGQFAYHGPLPYLLKASILNVLRIPVTHESVRLWVLLVWVLSALIGATAIRNLTGNRIFATGGLLVLGLHLFPLRYNPGHPEDLVVLFLLISVLVASADVPWLTENVRAGALGLVGALLLATKINVGFLYLLASAAWLLASAPLGKLWRIVTFVFLAGFTAVPAILMHRAWGPEWQLLFVSTTTTFLTCLVAFRRPPETESRWSEIVGFIACMTAGLVVVVGVTILNGSHLSDILEATVLTAAKHPQVFLRPMSFGPFIVPIMTAFAVISAHQCWRIAQARDLTVGASQSVLKIALSLSTFLFVSVWDAKYYLPLIGPVAWLIVFPGPPNAISERNRRARLFLALAAVFQMLQIFPVIGTQSAWSALLLCVCSLLLLHDGTVELSLRRIPRYVKLAAVLAGGLAAFSVVSFTLGLWTAYWRTPTLGFSNSRLIRMPMAIRANFDWIVASTSRYCDAVVTQPGMNSLVLWSQPTGRLGTSPILITGWPLILSDSQQEQMVAKLTGTRRICAVYNKHASEWWTKDDPQLNPSKVAREPLVAYIQTLQAVRKVGDYEIRANPAAQSAWNEDYLSSGERDFSEANTAVGIPNDLLTGEGSELRFGFQTTHGGLILSIPARMTGSSEDLLPMEPIIYISQDGALMIRSKPSGHFSVAKQAGVLDGKWHEFSLRREAGGWMVSIDSAPCGHIDALLTEGSVPRYFQLGPAFVRDGSGIGPGWVQFFGRLSHVRVGETRSAIRFEALHTSTALRAGKQPVVFPQSHGN